MPISVTFVELNLALHVPFPSPPSQTAGHIICQPCTLSPSLISRPLLSSSCNLKWLTGSLTYSRRGWMTLCSPEDCLGRGSARGRRWRRRVRIFMAVEGILPPSVHDSDCDNDGRTRSTSIYTTTPPSTTLSRLTSSRRRSGGSICALLMLFSLRFGRWYQGRRYVGGDFAASCRERENIREARRQEQKRHDGWR